MDLSVFGNVVLLSAMGVTLHLAPLYTRPDLYFGVTVAPAFRRTVAGRLLLRNYRVALWCLTIGAMAAVVEVRHAPVVWGAYLAGVGAIQAVARSLASGHKVDAATSIEIDFAAPKERLPGGLIAVLLPFLLLFGAGFWGLSHARGVAAGTVIVRLASVGSTCLILTAIAFGILYRSKRICAAGPAAASERLFRHRVLRGVIVCEYLQVLLGTLDVLDAPRVLLVASSAAATVALAAYVVALMRSGQGGSRLPATAERVAGTSERVVGDRSADRCWKGGLIYFNHRDPAILVEKRMGIGYTMNFGSAWSWLFVGLILAIPSMLHLMRPVTTPDRSISQATASPDTEGSLRRYIDSLESGQPNYGEMSPTLAAAVELQLPSIRAVIRRLGDLRSIAYQGLDRKGSDVYEATFEHGRLEWHIAPLSADGKVTRRSFRELD